MPLPAYDDLAGLAALPRPVFGHAESVANRALGYRHAHPWVQFAYAVAGVLDVRTDSGRFIVQVGAFADAAKAKETRLKVERAGLTTYIHVAETPEGKRTRVRVGPFSNRADAEKAAAKIRGLDLPAAILTL